MRARLIVFAFLLFPGLVLADWTLNNDESRLSFISIKKGDVGEVHQFKLLKGKLRQDGRVHVTIELISVDTAVPIRDERMQKMLFETNLFPSADLRARVKMSPIDSLKPGQTHRQTVKADLSLHGDKQTLNLELLVARLAPGKLLVTSYKPLVIDARAFGLEMGVEALRKVVNLPSISRAVPVSFVITFDSES